MKRWWVLAAMLSAFLLGALPIIGCDDDDDGGDHTPPADDDADDDDSANGGTDDDTIAGEPCFDPLLNQYAEFCPDYDDPCAANDGEIQLDDNDPSWGNKDFLTGELEGTQFKLDSPFHVKKIKLYF